METCTQNQVIVNANYPPRRKTKPPKSKRQAWQQAKAAAREKSLMYGTPNKAETIAAENLRAIDKPRKPMPRTFLAREEHTVACAKCHVVIEVGDRVHVRPSDGRLVHHVHRHVEPEVEVCSTCWLTKPCECDQ